ncbi:MAG: discoidin domain-containing protein [Anaerolineae bacterium]
MASDRPVIHAYCNDVPIRRFGFTWMLEEAPDLVDDVSLQLGNDAPRTKVHPKKSWEIRSNRLGATTTRMPRTPENDYLPEEAIHLIDGNTETCWSSRGRTLPNVEPVWIRLDLPMERPLSKVVLRKRSPGGYQRQVGQVSPPPGAVEVGRGMPGELTIKLSRDGNAWETVFEGPSEDTPERYDFTCAFDARPAKQIWITGRSLPTVENWQCAFSIAQVEVYDTRGRNVALACNGTGVTVSSSFHGFGLDTTTHRWLWPLHYYAGMKWARVGYHDDPINWHWVEKERGVLEVDSAADESITELAEHGVQTVMALGFGNRLYSGPDPKRMLPQLWEWYYENPAPPTTPEALEAWGRYVRYMAEHFQDRVQHFEVWNEWNIPAYYGAAPSAEEYLAIAHTAIPILREVCPDAKVMLGSWAGFPHGMSSWSEEELARQEKENLYLRVTKELAPEVDEIGWHPFYSQDPDTLQAYPADAKALLAWLERVGFKGHCMVTEWSTFAEYPAAPKPKGSTFGEYKATEMDKAKYVAQVHVEHTALGLESFFCELFHIDHPGDLSLTRRTFAADPIAPQQPQAALYVTRNLATALEDLQPDTFGFTLETTAQLRAYPMQGPEDRVLALWQFGRPHDDSEGTPVDVWVDVPCTQATGYEPLNGTAQNLVVERQGERSLLRGVLVRDYPLLLRLK